MAKRGFRYAVLVGLGAASAMGGNVAALDLPTSFVPRCSLDELRPGLSGQDPCREQFAVFGLRGPAVLASVGADIETTGSISRGTGSRQQPASGAKR